MQRLVAAGRPCRAMFSIHPLHTVRVDDNMPFDHITAAADGVFSICGPYWYDTIESTPFAHWKPKITRLDIPADGNAWPHRKTSFNPPGKRGVVYVGSSMPHKNLGLMTEVAARMPRVRFDWYGGSGDHPLARLANVHVEGWQHFSHEKVADICGRNDIFLNVSYSDANPTTLTEFGLASGLIPLVTHGSGYWGDDHFVNVPDNHKGIEAVLNEWLHKPSEELAARSLANRRFCEEQFNWKVFCDRIFEKILPYLA